MREFTRIVLRVAMVLFLMVGCVQNVYYLGELTKNNTNTHHHYNRYGGYSTTVDLDEVEEVTPTSTEQQEQEEENDVQYPDYNRPMTPY